MKALWALRQRAELETEPTRTTLIGLLNFLEDWWLEQNTTETRPSSAPSATTGSGSKTGRSGTTKSTTPSQPGGQNGTISPWQKEVPW